MEWFAQAHKDEKEQYSSMRIAGTVCLSISFLLMLFSLTLYFKDKEYAKFAWSIGFNFLATSGTLYGAGQVRGIFNGLKTNPAIPVNLSEQPKTNPEGMPK